MFSSLSVIQAAIFSFPLASWGSFYSPHRFSSPSSICQSSRLLLSFSLLLSFIPFCVCMRYLPLPRSILPLLPPVLPSCPTPIYILCYALNHPARQASRSTTQHQSLFPSLPTPPTKSIHTPSHPPLMYPSLLPSLPPLIYTFSSSSSSSSSSFCASCLCLYILGAVNLSSMSCVSKEGGREGGREAGSV